MDVELLFGLMLLAFIAVWALWLVAITRGFVPGVIGFLVGLLALFVGLVAINDERRDQQQERYGEALREFIAIVSEDQAAAWEQNGRYDGELPELGEEIIDHPGSIFEQEQTLEPDLSGDRRGFEVQGSLGDQEFTRSVDRSRPGEPEETRTCTGTAAAGCDDGTW
jgi:hypothetical protein